MEYLSIIRHSKCCMYEDNYCFNDLILPLSYCIKLKSYLITQKSIYFVMHTARSSKFYIFAPTPDDITLQSARYPGKYLMIQNGTVTVAEPIPTETSHLFEIVVLDSQGAVALRTKDDCYLAFNNKGRPFGPCGLSQEQPEVRLHFEEA